MQCDEAVIGERPGSIRAQSRRLTQLGRCGQGLLRTASGKNDPCAESQWRR